ncbi:MAG: hypothetical protein AAF497_12260, partial [Planctomycetota bacterium]
MVWWPRPSALGPPKSEKNLFAGSGICECNHCNSVYSPAAYFVELLEFLRSGNMSATDSLDKIHDTVLGKLIQRRPDLIHLELSCENTNTVLPYIDLANEVMESYVSYLHDIKPFEYAEIDVHNVDDETSSQQLASHRYTKNDAYERLSQTVYPFTLPYHLPIDEARAFLKKIETTREKVLDTFRSKIDTDCAHDPDAAAKLHEDALQRAVDAESLGLTQEQYIILTQQGFYPKEFYEADTGQAKPNDEYLEDIRVRSTHEYFGYAKDKESEMLDPREEDEDGNRIATGLRFVKEQLLPRTGIEYSDLVEILKTKYVNQEKLEGKPLATLRKIDYSYRFLQTLVKEVKKTDPTTGKEILVPDYTDLIAFLKDKMPCDPDIEDWVNDHFADLGKIIVLESGPPEFSATGTVWLQKDDGSEEKVGLLLKNGVIADGDTRLGQVTGTANGKHLGVIKFGDPSKTFYSLMEDVHGALKEIQVRSTRSGRVVAKISDLGIYRESLEVNDREFRGRVIHKGTDLIGNLQSDGTITVERSGRLVQVGFVDKSANVYYERNLGDGYKLLTAQDPYKTGKIEVLRFDADDVIAKIVSERSSGNVTGSRLVRSALDGIDSDLVRSQVQVDADGVNWDNDSMVLDESGIISLQGSPIGRVKVTPNGTTSPVVVNNADEDNFFDSYGRRNIEVRTRDQEGNLQNRVAFITATGLVKGDQEVFGTIHIDDDPSSAQIATLLEDGNILQSGKVYGQVDVESRVFAEDEWFYSKDHDEDAGSELIQDDFYVFDSTTPKGLIKKVEIVSRRLVHEYLGETIGLSGLLYKTSDTALAAPVGFLLPNGSIEEVTDGEPNGTVNGAVQRAGTNAGQAYAENGNTLKKENGDEELRLLFEGVEVGKIVNSGLVTTDGTTPFDWQTETRNESQLFTPSKKLEITGRVSGFTATGEVFLDLGMLSGDGQINLSGTLQAKVDSGTGIVTGTATSSPYFAEVKASNPTLDEIRV